MDPISLIGVIAGLALILGAGSQHVDLLFDPRQLFLVVGGGVIATLIAHPLGMAVRLPAILWRALLARRTTPVELVERAVQFAEMARREGIISLEANLTEEDDPFFRGGLRLAIDGTEPDLIMDILETELQFIEERHEHHGHLVRAFGRGCVFFGGIGALLTGALQGGTGLAGSALLQAATLPLLYGVTVYGLAEALARKLAVVSVQEVHHKRMVIEAVMSIQSGDNPRIVEHKLCVFLEPRLRPGPGSPQDATSPAAPAGVDEELLAEVRARTAEQRSRSSQFEFDDTLMMSDANLQRALREIDQKDLVIGLKGASEAVREKFLGNMSERVRTFIGDEISLSQVGAADIVETQDRISAQLRQLAQQGKLELPESDA